ncbi:hypothetical protein HK104_007754, partial [Borealophlyctis nickersoniae]
TPSPVLPYELIRLIAQRSSLATAARLRCLDWTTSRVILTADLVLIKAVGLRKYGLGYALEDLASALRRHSVQSRPDISEALYITLVKWGVDPEKPKFQGADSLVMLAICFSHFNVVRAMVAAGVDVLRLFDQYRNDSYEKDYHKELTNPESFKFLVEELGYEPTPGLLSFVVRTGQCENAAYLVSRGADPSTIEEDAIEAVIASDNVKTLEWLMQNRVDLHASEMLERRLESDRGGWNQTQERISETVEFLLRQGADPLFIRDDKSLLGRAIHQGLWEVASVMLSFVGSSINDAH